MSRMSAAAFTTFSVVQPVQIGDAQYKRPVL
jgi:hypothetical protein